MLSKGLEDGRLAGLALSAETVYAGQHDAAQRRGNTIQSQRLAKGFQGACRGSVSFSGH
jgi:hypothetical protein